MKNNKGSVLIILGVIAALALLGGGVVYYKNSQNTSNSNTQNIDIKDSVKSLFETTSNMSPKELYIKRNTEMYNAKSFEDMWAVGKKYDSVAKIQEDADQVKYMNDEKKKALFGFAQVFLTPTEAIISVEEKINADSTVVIAKTAKGKEIQATFVKEGNSWKLSDEKIVNLGSK